MNVVATILFPVGAVAIAIAFAAHVGHAVLLANGRRSLSLAFNRPTAQPAWAGAVTGSFADARAASLGAGPADTPLGLAPTPLGRAASGIAWFGFATLLGYLIIRGLLVGRGPWGNMFEFTVAFATSITGGYLVLGRRYPIRSIGFIPTGVALALLLYAASLPSNIS
jgi:ABC-type transport system involved in cytochrome c biogenesis permease subunit